MNSASRPFLLASLSLSASSDPGNGHYFWLYDFLQKKQSNLTQTPLAIGKKSQSCSHVQGVISSSGDAHLSVSLTGINSRDYGRIRRAVHVLRCQGVTHIQCYDGGLAELLAILRLARDCEDVRFIYNFHWAIDWLSLLKSKGIVARGLVRLVRRLLVSKPQNLFLAAESRPLATELIKSFPVKIDDFPIITTLERQEPQPWSSRNIDVLMIPQRAHEVPFCRELRTVLQAHGFSAKIGMHQNLEKKTPPDPSHELVVSLPLASGTYRGLLSSSRILMLPYNKPYFGWGSSGKFNDAIAVGTFPLVPSNTAIATKSSIDESQHHFQLDDSHDALEKIRFRLSAGFPPELLAVYFEDLRDWAESFRPSASSSTSVGTILLGTAMLFAVLYRPERQRKLVSRVKRLISGS